MFKQLLREIPIRYLVGGMMKGL